MRTVLAATMVLGCAAGSDGGQTPARDGGGYIAIPDAGPVPTCRGNLDGVIERSEVVFVPGVQVRYRINPSATLARVVPAGTAIASVEFAYGSAVCPPWVRCVLASLDPTPLERAESLEQLRALEHGIRIKAVETSYDSVSVDTAISQQVRSP